MIKKIEKFVPSGNNIEDETLETENVPVFRNKEKERLRIVEMRQCEAEREGIDRKTRWRVIENM